MRKLHPLFAGVLLALAMAGCNRADDDVAVDTAAHESAVDLAVAGPAPVATPPAGTLTVAGSGDGAYLADHLGRALYVLEDDDGKRCVGDCLQAWQPLTGATPVAGADGVQGPMISSISRDDGTMHVTYNGLPLYYFARDTGPGMTLGQAVEDAWGRWYLVRPSGEMMPATTTPASHVDDAVPPAEEGGKSPTAAGADARGPATTPPGRDPRPAPNGN